MNNKPIKSLLLNASASLWIEAWIGLEHNEHFRGLFGQRPPTTTTTKTHPPVELFPYKIIAILDACLMMLKSLKFLARSFTVLKFTTKI